MISPRQSPRASDGPDPATAIFPTAYIHITDSSYLWVTAYMASSAAAQAQIRDFQLSTSEMRQVRQSGGALRSARDGVKGGPTVSGAGVAREHSASWSAQEIIGQVLPTYSAYSLDDDGSKMYGGMYG
jgi:chaperone BCS1